jgi:hypothetical protein
MREKGLVSLGSKSITVEVRDVVEKSLHPLRVLRLYQSLWQSGCGHNKVKEMAAVQVWVMRESLNTEKVNISIWYTGTDKNQNRRIV